MSLEKLEALVKDGAKKLEESKKFQLEVGGEYPEFQRAELPMPDALVLLKVTQKCQKCGAREVHTNKHLHIRFGENIVAIRKWSGRFNALAREVTDVEQEVSSCETCFAGGVLFDDRVASKPKKF